MEKCCCMKMELVEEHRNGKSLYNFTEEELEYFPLKYLLDKAKPLELLYAWHKLSREYTQDFNLQTRLPCFIHYNRPEWVSHIDGPPSSQNDCRSCNLSLMKK